MPELVRFDRVSKRFSGVVALREVSFTIREGEVTALLGRNGAGKTTAIRIALGLIKADGGSATVWGTQPGSPMVRQRLAAMLQQTALPDELTLSEVFTLFASYYPAPERPPLLAERLGLTHLLRRRYSALSGGQKRLAQFAIALLGAPQCLVLDEPTTGLDADARAMFWNGVRGLMNDGVSVLLTTHYLEEADALADRILLMHEGALVADGQPEAIKARLGAKRIRCRTSLTDAAVLALPGLLTVARQGAMTDMTTAAPEPALRALLAADPAVADLTVTGGDLESAIMHLTAAPAQEPRP